MVLVLCDVAWCHRYVWTFRKQPVYSTRVKDLPKCGGYIQLSTKLYAVSFNAVGLGFALQAGISRVRFLMGSLEFFIDIILPITLWPWSRLSI